MIDFFFKFIKLARYIKDTIPTFADFVHDPTETKWQAHNGSIHGHAFTIFKRRSN